MTTETITLTSVCTGGNHLTFTASGALSVTQPMALDEILAPIDNDDIRSFVKVIAKMAKNGRTIGQARTLLQAGVTVVV